MVLAELRDLLDYHYWARDVALNAAAALTPEQLTRDLASSFRSVRDTLGHLYGAEAAWYERWHGTSPTALLPADRFPDVPTLRTAWREQEALVRAFVEGLGEEGVNRSFQYTPLSGPPTSAIFSQNLQHIVNHGSYHRGQVTTMLRQLGAQPPASMDMIRFFRTRVSNT